MRKCLLAGLTLLVLAATNVYASQDATVNERLPLTGKELEKHWQIDCQEVAATVLTWVAAAKRDKGADIHGIDWHGLQLCAAVYNVKETGRYRPCPDFKNTQRLLERFRSSHKEEDFLSITQFLQGCKNNE